MANTTVFTLGLGVTLIKPIGSEFDSLRERLERLRDQADGTRLGRLIGEIIRLGLELGKVNEVGRSLGANPVRYAEDLIVSLGRQIEQAEALTQSYRRLGEVVATLPSVQAPLAAAPEQRVTPQDPVLPTPQPQTTMPTEGQPPERVPRPAEQQVQVAGALMAGGIVTTIAGYKASRHLPPEQRKQAFDAVTAKVAEDRVAVGAKAAKALLVGEGGHGKAEGVGAVLGEFGGELLGSAVGTLFKNKRVGKYLEVAGGLLGEEVGKWAGGSLFNLTMFESAAKPKASDATVSSPQSAAGEGQNLAPSETDGAVTVLAGTAGILGAAAAASPLLGAMSRGGSSRGAALVAPWFAPGIDRAVTPLPGQVAAPASSAPLPTGATGSSPPALGRQVVKRIPGVAVLDIAFQLADTFASEGSAQEKAQGYGGAVGGLGGSLAGAAAGAAIGSVVPVIGTAIGGLIGGVLGGIGGERVGGWFGRALFSGADKDDAKGGKEMPANPVAPAPAAQVPANSMPPSPINQQFTFTANMPVTFTNSLDDPLFKQRLEAIAREQLAQLMRQARDAQMYDQSHVA